MTNTAGRLQGKIIAVAGAGGIGDELARRFATEGATVVLGARSAERIQAVAAAMREEGLAVTASTLDGADEASVAAFFDGIAKEHDALDGVHINFTSFADAMEPTDVVDMPMATYDEVMRVSARGYVLCTQAALPLLLARGGGSILYTSSAAAYDAAPVQAAYAMAKEAGHALMRHVATAFGDRGVRANTVMPGFIPHHTTREEDPATFEHALSIAALKTRTGETTDIAAISALLMSDEGGFITGQVIAVDGGVTMRP